MYPVPTNANANAETPNRRRLWQMIGATGILLIPLLVIWWPGCRQYPAVTSKESLGLMKLLYAACNTKDPARLARAEQGMEKTTREGKMSPAEQEAFAKIIGMAKAGEWERAEKAAFKFAQDQVGQGSAETHVQEQHDKKSPKR